MRKINVKQITDAVAKLSIDSNYYLCPDVLNQLKASLKSESSKLARKILSEIIENAKIAANENMPMCQDTGITVVFLEIGQGVEITGGDLYLAVNEGVRKGYLEGYLRKSVVSDPINRVNTKDNTPAVIHTDIVPGNKIKIIIAPKGAGSENMSKLAMLKPSDGIEGVKNFIIETVKSAGAGPCPPIIVGVGIGGTMEMAALLSKKALLRKIGGKSSKLEKELLTQINKLGIGPMGLGGRTTALAVHIETYPCHIASLPVAVNIGCHANRHKEIII